MAPGIQAFIEMLRAWAAEAEAAELLAALEVLTRRMPAAFTGRDPVAIAGEYAQALRILGTLEAEIPAACRAFLQAVPLGERLAAAVAAELGVEPAAAGPAGPPPAPPPQH